MLIGSARALLLLVCNFPCIELCSKTRLLFGHVVTLRNFRLPNYKKRLLERCQCWDKLLRNCTTLHRNSHPPYLLMQNIRVHCQLIEFLANSPHKSLTWPHEKKHTQYNIYIHKNMHVFVCVNCSEKNDDRVRGLRCKKNFRWLISYKAKSTLKYRLVYLIAAMIKYKQENVWNEHAEWLDFYGRWLIIHLHQQVRFIPLFCVEVEKDDEGPLSTPP